MEIQNRFNFIADSNDYPSIKTQQNMMQVHHVKTFSLTNRLGDFKIVRYIHIVFISKYELLDWQKVTIIIRAVEKM